MHIRTRLLLLILLATLPLVAVQIYNEWSLRAERERELRAAALADAQMLSHELNRLVGGVELLLASLSHRDFSDAGMKGCNAYMRHLAASFPLASNIGISDARGRVLCLNTPFERGKLYNPDRLYFRRAVDTRAFAVGEYMVGRATGKRVLAFGSPLFDEGGDRIAGVAYASIDLDGLADELLKRPLRRNSSLTITDAEGTILVRSPERGHVGERLSPAWMEVLAHRAPGVIHGPSLFGDTERVIAYVPLDRPPVGLFVAVGLDRTDAMRAVNASTARSLVTMVVALLLSVALTFWFGRYSIRRPIDRLIGAARSWKGGDLAARARLKREDAEFVQIGETFDEMAEALAEHERQRDAVEQALRASRDEAMRASASKTEFLASASHDLRQPLQAMSMTVAVLAARAGGDKPRELALLQRAVENLSTMVDGMMDVAQLDSGLVQPKLEAVELEPLMLALRDEFGEAARQQGLALRLHACPTQVRSDPVLLGRILRNLVSNALKFTPDGGSVEVKCEDAGDEVAISVRDTGIGIPPDQQSRVFEEFHQINNPERDRRKGLGLGLAIVKRLAVLLEHRLGVESVPGQGSTFTVFACRVAAPATAQRDGRTANLTLRRDVLVVEDDELVSESTAGLLESWGATVTRARTAEEAYALTGEPGRRFDIAIVDYRLPTASGLEVIARLRARWPMLRTLLLTGDAAAALAAGEGEGKIDVLRKPVSADRLAALLAPWA